MRLINKKFRFILFGFLLCFFGYLSINYVDTNRFTKSRRLLLDDKNADNNENNHANKINHIHVHKPYKSYLKVTEPDYQNNSLVENNDKPRRFLAYDGGGFGSINSGITECGDDIEIELTNQLMEADFSYFHMNAPEKMSPINKKSLNT